MVVAAAPIMGFEALIKASFLETCIFVRILTAVIFFNTNEELLDNQDINYNVMIFLPAYRSDGEGGKR